MDNIDSRNCETDAMGDPRDEKLTRLEGPVLPMPFRARGQLSG